MKCQNKAKWNKHYKISDIELNLCCSTIFEHGACHAVLLIEPGENIGKTIADNFLVMEENASLLHTLSTETLSRFNHLYTPCQTISWKRLSRILYLHLHSHAYINHCVGSYQIYAFPFICSSCYFLYCWSPCHRVVTDGHCLKFYPVFSLWKFQSFKFTL